MYGYICSDCGAHLDPGEKCDCKQKEQEKKEFYNRHLKIEPNTRQLRFAFGNGERNYESKSCY